RRQAPYSPYLRALRFLLGGKSQARAATSADSWRPQLRVGAKPGDSRAERSFAVSSPERLRARSRGRLRQRQTHRRLGRLERACKQPRGNRAVAPGLRLGTRGTSLTASYQRRISAKLHSDWTRQAHPDYRNSTRTIRRALIPQLQLAGRLRKLHHR